MNEKRSRDYIKKEKFTENVRRNEQKRTENQKEFQKRLKMKKVIGCLIDFVKKSTV